IKALTRLPMLGKNDSGVDTIAMATSSSDGASWSDLAPIGPETWSFWRIKEQGGVFYSAAYEDGDLSVSLFSSSDGTTWTQGPAIVGGAVGRPEGAGVGVLAWGKAPGPQGKGGPGGGAAGGRGRLRTKVCWADPPYATFDCPQELMGQRLDGPVSFFHDSRL